MRAAASVVIVAVSLALWPTPAWAQIDFSGAWTLDREISSDLTKLSFEPVETQARRNPGGFSGGFGGRGGIGGRLGGGRRPGGATDAGRAGAFTVDERTALREIADFVKALSSIVIEHSDHSTLTVTDALGRARLFPTDGTVAQHAFATATVETTTTWDGPHLVTRFHVGATRDLVFTYILVPATRQMALRIALDDSGRARADVPELRLVYKKAPKTATPEAD
jgi:hypothetical protein